MPWIYLFAYLSAMSSTYGINRQVYKIVLTQNGYAQFLQYDVETPPIKEFTFCTWIRVYGLTNDQTIFSYIVNGNSKVMRLWLDAGGKHITLSVNGKITSSYHIDVVKDVWRHVCLSYQSDFGAWALYVDSRLLACESAQSLAGYILPAAGSVIIGYGIGQTGKSSGLEGEIFGTNMILVSTIAKNATTRNDPFKSQKSFKRNKLVKEVHDENYIILRDLQTDEIHNSFEKAPFNNATKSFIKFLTPHGYVEHNVGTNLVPKKQRHKSNVKEVHELSLTDLLRTVESDKFNLNWHIGHKTENPSTNLQVLPLVSEYETPPLPSNGNTYADYQTDKPIRTEFISKQKDGPRKVNELFTEAKTDALYEIETPPPIDKNKKVYGQWTSSQFAGSVLNYIKNFNIKTKEHHSKRVPPTIHLNKVSDAYPYPSELVINRLRPPSQFARKSLLEKRFDQFRKPQINVQIIENDIRSSILKMHAETQPRQVEITNRGDVKKRQEHRFYRNTNYEFSEDFNNTDQVSALKQINESSNKINNLKATSKSTLPDLKLKSVLPFLKYLEYFIENSSTTDSKAENTDMYTKSLSQGNKWHNVKSYNSDFTPRKIYSDPTDEIYIDGINKRYPSIWLKYTSKKNKVQEDKDPIIIKGRELAMEVSNKSESNKNSVSILKYNHGYLSTQESRNKFKRHKDTKSDFNKQIKIGNALNERHVIGDDDHKRKQSFIGGLANIPDINRYRSEIDNENVLVPSSLGPRACKNLEQYDGVLLYVQKDESIDVSHILSPIREQNVAIQFIIQNYQKCSLKDSVFNTNPKLFIDWSTTPVRLFGGAIPKTTTDLCGFF